MSNVTDELNRGWQVHQQSGPAAAEPIYREVLKSRPDSANAWCYLGMACHDQNRFDEAVECYRRAVGLQPVFPIAFNNLGNTLRMQRRLAEAVAAFDEALRQRPGYLNAIKNKGTALLWEGRIDDADEAYRQAAALAPSDAEVRKNIGVIELLTGRLSDGWRNYESRFEAAPGVLPRIDAPRWDGSPLAGRTLLLAAEQGMGDTLHFARYVPWLKRREACRIVLYCQAGLGELMATLPGVDVVASNRLPPPPCDVWAPLVSVPGIAGHVEPGQFPAETPYLTAPSERVEAWKHAAAAWGGVKIGIVWQGNRQYQADRYRSVPLSAFEPLANLHGTSLISLQKGDGEEQLDEIGGRFDVVPLGARLDNAGGAFLDTAAVMKQLDLVVTVDTSAAHLAGALGVPVWLALAQVPDWRWFLERSDSPWYPSVRLFRQRSMGEWESVFAEMADALLRERPEVRRRRPEERRVATTGRNRLVRGRHGLVLYNRHDLYVGRSLDRYGEFSEGEVELFKQVVKPGATVVEAGANVGSHTVALARLAGETGRVFAFEPQRLVFQTLCANLALNSLSNVDARCEALGAAPGETFVPKIDYERENNFGGLSVGDATRGERVRVATIDSLELSRCDFLKIDVEGQEIPVLEGARATLERCRPVLYVENDREDRSARLIERLLEAGYDLYWHLPQMFNPRNGWGESQDIFPGVASINMLGVHRSTGAQIVGLRKIESPASDWRTTASS